jgi:hypothetical protein
MYQMYHSEEVGMFYTYVLGYMILHTYDSTSKFSSFQTNERS